MACSGSFNTSNTLRQCGGAGAADAQGGGCPALAANEWLALAGSFRYDAKTRRATFRSSTRIKKSTINSSLQPPSDVLAVESGQVVRLGEGGVSAAFRVDAYSYQLLVCAEPRCGLAPDQA